MKRLALILALTTVGMMSASVASASKPTRVYSPFSNASFPGVCSFTVDRVILQQNSYLTTYSDGTQRYTGVFKERLINDSTGKYIDFNGSGPVILVYNADGTITETDFGPQFERPPGQLLLTTGQYVWTYDSAFNVLSAQQRTGTSRDVCALLG